MEFMVRKIVQDLKFLETNQRKSLLGMIETNPEAVLNFIRRYSEKDFLIWNYFNKFEEFCSEIMCYDFFVTDCKRRVYFKTKLKDDVNFKIVFSQMSFYVGKKKRFFTGIDDLIIQLKNILKIS